MNQKQIVITSIILLSLALVVVVFLLTASESPQYENETLNQTPARCEFDIAYELGDECICDSICNVYSDLMGEKMCISGGTRHDIVGEFPYRHYEGELLAGFLLNSSLEDVVQSICEVDAKIQDCRCSKNWYSVVLEVNGSEETAALAKLNESDHVLYAGLNHVGRIGEYLIPLNETQECMVQKQDEYDFPGNYFPGEISVRLLTDINETQAKNIVESYGLRMKYYLLNRRDNSSFIWVKVPVESEIEWMCKFEQNDNVQYTRPVNIGGLANAGNEKYCEKDSDCVPATCLSPSEVVNRYYAPKCGAVTSVPECRGLLDCGCGEPVCINNTCEIKKVSDRPDCNLQWGEDPFP